MRFEREVASGAATADNVDKQTKLVADLEGRLQSLADAAREAARGARSTFACLEAALPALAAMPGSGVNIVAEAATARAQVEAAEAEAGALARAAQDAQAGVGMAAAAAAANEASSRRVPLALRSVVSAP